MKHSLTIREEANALTCSAFRHGYIKKLHAGKYSELLEQPGLMRITQAEMKRLMVEASANLAELLALKEANPEKYWPMIESFHSMYCDNWEK